MFYVIRVKGWPVLVWLEVKPPPGRYEVVGRFDNLLHALAGFYAAVARARSKLAPRPLFGPGSAGEYSGARRGSWTRRPGSPGVYRSPGAKTMSPLPPPAKKRLTYDSET